MNEIERRKLTFRRKLDLHRSHSGDRWSPRTLKKLADEAGVPYKLVQRWAQHGLAHPHPDTEKHLKKLCDHFGIDYATLWDTDEITFTWDEAMQIVEALDRAKEIVLSRCVKCSNKKPPSGDRG